MAAYIIIIIYVAILPNEPHQCILTHFNNSNFSKAQTVLLDDRVLHRNMQELFNVNFNANFKLFLSLSNCASVGGKTLIIIKMHGMYVEINLLAPEFYI